MTYDVLNYDNLTSKYFNLALDLLEEGHETNGQNDPESIKFRRLTAAKINAIDTFLGPLYYDRKPASAFPWAPKKPTGINLAEMGVR